MSPISRKRLGSSDLDISQLSVGSWHTYDRMDFADTVALLRAAVDAGINLFDVGVYGFPGMPAVFTDVIWGAAIRAAGVPREDYLVSAKLWLEGFGPDGFRPQLENALLRGGFGIADLVILGDIRRDDIVLEDLVADLARLKSAGLIRAWGVNNWSATNIRKLQQIAAETGVDGPDIAQLKYSVARRAIPDGEPFGALFADGFAMQASDVLEGGLLVGSASGREVGRDPGGVQAKIKERAAEFAALAEQVGTSPARLAVAFTLTHPANITTLFGATKMSQLEDNLAAVELVERIGAAELRALVEPFWADQGIVDPEGP
ncbi:aldo/keto reductase [Actinokineospora enzanensis]|uniref:aldo/keto reductase n=1 Tax=Actinokineospora enzanensis TaxID=155975 RepID=UPI00036C5283|nr:aldo/keto reductase [Actinokineospora enzanensis]